MWSQVLITWLNVKTSSTTINLLELISFLDCSQSIYILKELVRLHQKLLTCSFPETCESLPIHSSLLKLFQSDIFVKSAQSWLGSLSCSVNHMKVQCHPDAGVRTTDSTAAGNSSVTKANEQGLTLKSSLISIVIRKFCWFCTIWYQYWHLTR